MIFNSLTFVVFFAIVLAAHNAPFFSWHQKKINLMIFSYLFYAAWNPPFVILLWVSTVVDWWAAQWMVRSTRQSTRKAWMIISVVPELTKSPTLTTISSNAPSIGLRAADSSGPRSQRGTSWASISMPVR